MGIVRSSANATFRDYSTAGVPASGAHEPIKSEIRATFGAVEDRIVEAEADIAAALLSGENIYADTTAGLAASDADNLLVDPHVAPAEVVGFMGAETRVPYHHNEVEQDGSLMPLAGVWCVLDAFLG